MGEEEISSPVTLALMGCLELRELDPDEAHECAVVNVYQVSDDTYTLIRRCGREVLPGVDSPKLIGRCMLNSDICIMPRRYVQPPAES